MVITTVIGFLGILLILQLMFIFSAEILACYILATLLIVQNSNYRFTVLFSSSFFAEILLIASIRKKSLRLCYEYIGAEVT